MYPDPHSKVGASREVCAPPPLKNFLRACIRGYDALKFAAGVTKWNSQIHITDTSSQRKKITR